MGHEYRIRFDDPQWFARNRAQLVQIICDMPSFIAEKSSNDEIWLKDSSSKHGWEFDVRLFLEQGSIFVEVSSDSAAFSRDVRHLYEAIAPQTSVRMEDEDDPNEEIGPKSLFKKTEYDP